MYGASVKKNVIAQVFWIWLVPSLHLSWLLFIKLFDIGFGSRLDFTVRRQEFEFECADSSWAKLSLSSWLKMIVMMDRSPFQSIVKNFNQKIMSFWSIEIIIMQQQQHVSHFSCLAGVILRLDTEKLCTASSLTLPHDQRQIFNHIWRSSKNLTLLLERQLFMKCTGASNIKVDAVSENLTLFWDLTLTLHLYEMGSSSSWSSSTPHILLINH